VRRLLLAALLSIGCKREPPPPPSPAPLPPVTSAVVPKDEAKKGYAGPWNVLFISIDSLRADMPWAGYARPIAPNLTTLWGESVAYTHAYSTSSYTSKSVPGMLSGRLPSELQRSGVFFTTYYAKNEFMCPALDAQDIPCVGGHAHLYFQQTMSGFGHGFRDWRMVPGITFDPQTDPYVTSDKLTPLAEEMLEKVKDKSPFFAWFHYMDPHDVYQKHAESPHWGDKPRDLYDEEVFFTDLWVGKLLDWVKQQPWAAHTAIVVTADHGEAFGEHYATRHAHEVWEELVRVPLLFYLPGEKPRVIETPRGAADLVPTFVDLLGAKPIEGLRGASLVSEIHGGEAAPRDVLVDLPEDDYNERRRAFIHENWKLISFGDDARFALFDLAADPHENEDQMWKNRAQGEDMRKRFKEAWKAVKEVPPRGGVPKHDR